MPGTPVFYINLDTRPDRRSRMEAQCKKLGVTPHRLSAITKIQVSQNLDLRSKNNLKLGFKSSSLDIDSLGQLACFHSHREAWKQILERNLEKAWILEDDAILRRVEDIEVNEDFPMVWLGLRGTPQTYRVWNYPYSVLNYDRECFGGHAYCLHKSIIPHLLHETETISLSVDYFLNEFFFSLGIRVGVTDLAYTNEFLSFSDVEHVPIGKPKSSWKYISILLVCLVCLWIYISK